MRLALLLLTACNYRPGTAPEPDAPPLPDAFDVASCPATYTTVVSSQPASHYRVILTAARPWEHSDACNADLPGATHLVAFETTAELAAINGVVDGLGNLPDNKAWIGGVQLRGQGQPELGWLSVTGGPLLDAWDGGEPNDGTIEDDRENFAGLERGRAGMIDLPSGDARGGFCECDGKPLDPTTATAIDANRL